MPGLISLIFITVGFFLIVNFLYFILPSLSPIPFFPTNKKDLSLIIQTLLNSNSNLIIDLGAGTGTVIFPTAHRAYQQKLKTQFIALEIHPLLILIMHLRRLFHPNKKNIKIIRSDLFKINLQLLTSNLQLLTIYLYVGPFVIERLKQKLINLPKKTMIISYMYQIPKWEEKLVKVEKSVNKIYIYHL